MANALERDSRGREGGNERREASGSGTGEMSVREAGQLGGEQGGQRVRELVEEGKRAERGDRD